MIFALNKFRKNHADNLLLFEKNTDYNFMYFSTKKIKPFFHFQSPSSQRPKLKPSVTKVEVVRRSGGQGRSCGSVRSNTNSQESTAKAVSGSTPSSEANKQSTSSEEDDPIRSPRRGRPPNSKRRATSPSSPTNGDNNTASTAGPITKKLRVVTEKLRGFRKHRKSSGEDGHLTRSSDDSSKSESPTSQNESGTVQFIYSSHACGVCIGPILIFF